MDLVPASIVDKIVALHPISNDGNQDLMMWLPPPPDGTFSVASAYSFLVGFHDIPRSHLAEVIWSWKDSDHCPRCPLTKTALHACRDCPLAHAMWKSLFQIDDSHHFFSMDLPSWCRLNLQCSKIIIGVVWNLVFGIAEDSLWQCRNILIFENTDTDLPPLLHEIAAKCRSIAKGLKGSIQALFRSTQPNNLIIRWVFPDFDWIKLNMDGAFSSSKSLAARGGVVRDHHGAFIFAFS
ncbi:unnamed protein product [Lupinus luteus]|uniref:Reverse transcriptase zinc-binding domain-containing protein n=1 Tax=Lupinus luteus TaxID=3873 RepID=A0AAV1XHQ1_LUPLU